MTAILISFIIESSESNKSVSPDEAPLSKKRWLALCLVAASATTVLAYQQANKPEQPTHRAQTLTVQVARTQVQEFKQDVVLTGTIAARDPLQIGAELSGLEVKEILVEEGQSVEKGQILLLLDTSLLQASLREVQGQLMTAKAAWQKSLQPNRRESIAVQRAAHQSAIATIAQRKAAIQKAKAEYDNAVSIASRYKQLYEEGGATAQDAEQKYTDVQSYQAALETATETFRQAELSAAQENEKLQELNSGGRSEDISAAAGTVQQHEAKISSLKAQIDQACIRAPDSGIISERLVHLGDISSAGVVMFKLIRKGELELIAKVSVDDLAKVCPGQMVSIVSQDETTEGRVWMVSPVVDPVTRLGKVRISLLQPGKLKNGMFVTATFSQASPQKAIVIPETALLSADGDNFVFVENRGRVKLTPVSVGFRSNHAIQIVKGLTGSESVVQGGVAFLSDNDLVTIR